MQTAAVRQDAEAAPARLYSQGHELDLDPDKYGELWDSSHLVDDMAALRSRMDEDGFWLMRGLIDRDRVLEARREIMLKYAIIGEIDDVNHPVMEGIQSRESFIDKVNLLAFTESVMTGQAYRSVVMDDALTGLLGRFFESPVQTFDFRWWRFMRPGETTGFHCDSPYINRGTQRVISAWIPLGDVPREEGGLIVLEGSHKDERLKERYSHKDADRDRLGWLSTNPITLQKNLGGRWLTTDYRAGDVIIFSMFLVHGTIDNHSSSNRCRLTSDTRYQPVGEPLDERWNGEQLNPHGGRRVYLPGLGRWNNNRDFGDEWKSVDERGRLVPPEPEAQNLATAD